MLSPPQEQQVETDDRQASASQLEGSGNPAPEVALQDLHSASNGSMPTPSSARSTTSNDFLPDDEQADLSALDRCISRAEMLRQMAYGRATTGSHVTYMYQQMDGLSSSLSHPIECRTDFYALEIVFEFTDGVVEFVPIEVACTEIDKMFDFGKYLYQEGQAFGPMEGFTISFLEEDGEPFGVASDGRSRVHARLRAKSLDDETMITTNLISYHILDTRPAERGEGDIFEYWLEFTRWLRRREAV